MFEYSDEDIEALFKGIFDGDIDPLNLPEDFYTAVANYLQKALYKGFGQSIDDVKMGTPDAELLTELRSNIYMFSAARTFQQTLEMSEQLVDSEGNLQSWSDFKRAAQEIYSKYNGGEVDDEMKTGWLKTEFDTAQMQGFNAMKWNKIEKQKKTLPYLRYVAVTDELVCDICSPLDGITLPVDDTFWSEYYPANHFNCRCVVEQLDDEEGGDDEASDDEVEQAKSESKTPDEFKINVGKDQEVFKSEGRGQHPYFIVPKEYRKFAESNFNLPIPDDDAE